MTPRTHCVLPPVPGPGLHPWMAGVNGCTPGSITTGTGDPKDAHDAEFSFRREAHLRQPSASPQPERTTIVQTFLPHPSYTESAHVLDRQRLGKQRVEAWQILRALTGQSTGWRNHPATKMWRGCEGSLALYGQVMCSEWIARGYKDSLWGKFADARATGDLRDEYPDWMGDDQFHRSHQSNLIRKLPDHYAALFPGVPDDLPYVWPTPVEVYA